MKKLYVYADFDWLKEVELIGELGYESLRGADSYSFTFNNEWLRQHSDLFLSDDLNNYPGQQYTQPDRDIFGCFSDALPDRWGRTLLLRREQIAAAEEKRPVRRLSSFDFLTGIDDFSRMGGFRFKEDPNGKFINVSESLRIPPLTDIRELIEASTEIEKSEEENILRLQHIYIADYQRLFILIGTTSVFTSTQNVGTNANSCILLLCIYVLYRLFSVLLWNVRYQIQGVD